MGQLALLAGQHGVGGQARDLRRLAQDDVADVEDDWVLRHLLEYAALVEQRPHQPVVLVVRLVPGLVLVLVEGGVPLVRLVMVIHYFFGSLHIRSGVHLLQLDPAGTLQHHTLYIFYSYRMAARPHLGYCFHNSIQVEPLWDLKVVHVQRLLKSASGI